MQTCLECGMSVSEAVHYCPKCDNELTQQNDGTTITVDIAHHGERVSESLRKMHIEIDLTRKGVAKRIRFIVGSGVIREEVILALRDLEFRGEINEFEQEPNNPGAVLVSLK